MSGHGGGKKGKKGGGHDEAHENHERWLVTYADMITLLMVLFIVLFAMSSVDQKKFAALKAGLAAGFGQSTSIMNGSSSILSESGTSTVQPVVPPRQQKALSEKEEVAVNQAVAELMKKQDQRAYADAQAEAGRLDGVRQRVTKALARHGMKADVHQTLDGRGLTISLVSKHVVFENDLATLTARGQQVVEALAPVLRDIPDDLSIEGHTNQVKVKPKYYDTDWDLSSARAVTVLRFLTDHEGIPDHRVSVAAYGHTRPLVDPSEAGSQELNKRVDIVVLATADRDGEAMLAQAARELDAEKAAARTSTTTTHPATEQAATTTEHEEH